MNSRVKAALNKCFAGRGVIVLPGLTVLIGITATEFLTLLTSGIENTPERSIRGAVVGLLLSVSLAIGLRWASTSLGAFLAILYFGFWDGGLFLWLVFSLIIFSVFAATVDSRIIRNWFLVLVLIWMGQYGVRAGDDAILLVALVPLSVLSFVLARIIFNLRERNLSAIRQMEEGREQNRVAIERERKNIARDLHDIVAHDITVVAMQSKAAKFANSGQAAIDAIDIIAKLSTETLHDLRLMLNVLRTDGTMSDSSGGSDDKPAATTVYAVQGLEIFTQRLKESGFSVTSHTDEKISELPRSAQTALYRVMQEATTNIIKHGKREGSCGLRLEISGSNAILEMTNQMPKSKPNKSDLPVGGIGLIGMQDRMNAFGGRFNAEVVDGRWVLTASIPF
ncbi:sensor histidine kinase [Glutamicibacter sp.]|uniref:sensor histidine kinase n=1 Tax=Glutamicibacter sp. TaxID=1931995 RepID=UPI002B465217|nr:histidine kinase [Glutamicibacter sp.]HJX77972.1 histidine kinase [Glutamicibacter sp.]